MHFDLLARHGSQARGTRSFELEVDLCNLGMGILVLSGKTLLMAAYVGGLFVSTFDVCCSDCAD